MLAKHSAALAVAALVISILALGLVLLSATEVREEYELPPVVEKLPESVATESAVPEVSPSPSPSAKVRVPAPVVSPSPEVSATPEGASGQ